MENVDFILNAAMLHLNMVEVKGEMNMNNQLVAIRKIREARNRLKEMGENENHDEQRENV